MNITIEAQLLLIRTFTMLDTNLIYKLNIDPDVTPHTTRSCKGRIDASEILEKVIIPQQILYNHGKWFVHVKPTLEFPGKLVCNASRGQRSMILFHGKCSKNAL